MQAGAPYANHRLARLGPRCFVLKRRRHARSNKQPARPEAGQKKTVPSTDWIPWIFAAKTTASGLIALLVAFTFDLDQPQWALLTERGRL